jgi:hypothetical protein
MRRERAEWVMVDVLFVALLKKVYVDRRLLADDFVAS